MANTVWPSASANAFSTTLNGTINDTVTTITLTSVTNLSTSGGVLVIDRQDGSGNNTPTVREFISFTGVSGSDLTGVTRGIAGSTAQSHNSGALVEETMSVTHWLDMRSYLAAEHTATGTHVISTATITTSIQASGATGVISDWMVTRRLYASGASTLLTDATISRSLNVTSGASITGNFPLSPMWYMPGFASAATTNVMRIGGMPTSGTFQFFTMMTRTPVSTASLTLDINKNGTSIFDTIGRINILGGGTFASTASIATKAFASGDTFTVDIDTGGNVADVTLIGHARGI